MADAQDTAAPPLSSRSVSLAPVIYGALALGGLHLAVSVAAGSGPGSGGALALIRAVLSALVMPLPGLPFALWLLLRGQPVDDEPPNRRVGAFALLAVAFGAALVLDYTLAVFVRLVGYPVTPYHFALLGLAAASLPLVFSGRLSADVRVGAEPGLSAGALVVAVALAVLFAAVAHHRLLSDIDRLSIVPSDPAVADLIYERESLPDRFIKPPRWTKDADRVAPHRVVPTGRYPQFVYRRLPGRPIRFVRLAHIVVAPPGTPFELWRVKNELCGLPPGEDEETTLLFSGEVPQKVLGVDVGEAAARFNRMVLVRLELFEGDNCFEYHLNKVKPRNLRRMEIVDVSHEDLEDWEAADGRFSFIVEGGAECHFNDANYRAHMVTSNYIVPELLLWGYFTQFVGESLAGGSVYPMLGVLFLFLALLCLMAGQVILGAALAGQRQTPVARAAPYLLLAPFVNHLISLVFLSTQSFAFPDAPYTVMLLFALALLLRRQRAGFVLLGCLAAFARYPGAYVLAVMLVGWLVLNRGDRRWTRNTLLWAVAAGVAVIGLVALHYATSVGVHKWIEGVHFEIFPEHFATDQGGIGQEQGGAPVVRRVAHFWFKLVVLAGFLPLLWPLIRRRVAALLVVVVVGYSLTLMAVQVPHSHYFQFLLYAAAVAGLAGLARRPERWPVAPVAAAGLLSVWMTYDLSRQISRVLMLLGLDH